MQSILICKENNIIEEYNIAGKKAILIGRHESNDICLTGSRISRSHAAIFCDMNGTYFLQDLGSRNHTYLQNNHKDAGIISDGDSIKIEDYTLIFKEQAKTQKQRQKRQKEIRKKIAQNIKTRFSPVQTSLNEIELLTGQPASLSFLYKLNRIANRNLELDEALRSIIELIAEKFKPDSILIGEFNRQKNGVKSLAIYPEDNAEIIVSHTIIQPLLQQKQVLMIHDVLLDERVQQDGQTAESILAQNIRSALAIPLMFKTEIIGILYMDSRQEPEFFKETDRNLFSLLGKDIASFLARGRNYETVKAEKTRLEHKFEIENMMIGKSPPFFKTLAEAERFAATDSPVLISGETGTGKELIANLLHKNSHRNSKPMITVNCATFDKNLIGSELFGHEKGAYTGAVSDKKGLFETADGATVFFDEIGELPLELQARLLRVLEYGDFQRIGNRAETIKVDVRIITATNRDLSEAVKNGIFRKDLYGRINVLNITVPPLRERKEDIPFLTGYFLYRERQKYGKRISRLSYSCINMLLTYDWPHNIRELKNAIERAVILADAPKARRTKEITPDLFDLKKEENLEPKSLKEIEKKHIERVLTYTLGNKEKAAKILGIAKQTLFNKGKEYRLPNFTFEKDKD